MNDLDAIDTMHAANAGPHVTCPASRHAAIIAEFLIRGTPYPMLAEEPAHCGESIAAAVEALWLARAELGTARELIALLEGEQERAETALAEMTRRRDEWRRKAEGFDAVRLALREKVGVPWPPSLSRALWAGLAADEKKRADDAEAQIATLTARLAERAAPSPDPRVRALVAKAEAVIARWDSTDWKAPPTADAMNELRAALAAFREGGEG